MPISTRDLSGLPDLQTLEKIVRSLAMLDAILSPEWVYRYFHFNPNWDPATGDRMASMRNGSGDEYFLLFTAAGAILKGFDHESPMSPWTRTEKTVWPGVLDRVPKEFAAFLAEPAFSLEDTTFCIWRRASDSAWHCGPIAFPEGQDPDGSERLLWALDGNPAAYAEWAHEYFDKRPDLDAVHQVFQHEPLTPALLAKLSSQKSMAEALHDAEEIGYAPH